MHKVLLAATAFGLLGLPILASAQNTNQPSMKKETASDSGLSTKKAAKANATKQTAKKGNMQRHAQVTKKKRFARHIHKTRHATAKHGKRFANSHGRHRQISAATSLRHGSAKSRTTNARGAVTAYRAELAPTQRNCGEFMYWKNGKCNDARNKPAK
jgi:hypothetical protein